MMKKTVSALVLFPLTLVHAATNYVDCVNGLDGDGRGASLQTAWKTLQYAVTSASAGDVILVAPGEYKDGFYVRNGTTTTNRVYITKNLVLKSIGGKECTHIVGGEPSGYDDPSGKTRCVEIRKTATSVVIDGFTIRGGNANEGSSVRGIQNDDGSLNTTLVDCTVSNCTSRSAGTFLRASAVRTLFTENGGRFVTYGGGLLNCVLARNAAEGTSAYPFAPVINCLYMENDGMAVRYSGANGVYNTLFMYDQPSVGNGVEGSATLVNCVATHGSGYCSNASVNCTFSAPFLQVMSPPEFDLRLIEDSESATAGNAEHLALFPLPEGYESERYKDFNGDPVPETGVIAAGPVQEKATPACGIYFSGPFVIDGKLWKASGTKPHSCYDRWPVQLKVKPEEQDMPPAFFKWLDRYLIPDPDDSYTVTLLPGQICGFSVYRAVNVLYVNKDEGDDGYSGTSETVGDAVDAVTQGPKRTIQGAVDASPIAENMSTGATVIYVDPGVYDEGESYWLGSNRVYVSSGRYLRIVGRGTAENPVVIKGSFDPSDDIGVGPAAVRCVGWRAVYGGIQGVTLTGGATTEISGDGDNGAYFRRGGAFLNYSGRYAVLSDCIVTNNAGTQGGTIYGGWVRRCFISDNVKSSNQFDMLQNCKLSSCVIDGNRFTGNGSDIGDSVYAYHCTIRASSGKNVFRGPPHAVLNCIVFDSVNDCRVAGAAGTSLISGTLYDNVDDSGKNTGYVEGSAAFADKAAGDFRLTSFSDAIGIGWNGQGGMEAHITNFCAYCTTGFEGEPLVFTDGKPTAGAYQRALLGVKVSGSAVTPAAGTYAVEPGGTFTVTADAGRRLLGYMINGEFTASRSYTYSVTADDRSYGKAESVTVEPVYGGMTFLVR